jgi:hypothetical protein
VNTKVKILLALFVIVLSSFFIGRRVEEAMLATRLRGAEAKAVLPSATVTPLEPTYRELAVADIIGLPFTEFYEALRSAPVEAREKWAAELEKMPPGPRRTAALAAFYKLLVQFEPVAATEMACGIKDKKVQELALASIVGAAPGFALRDMAELLLKVPADPSDYRKYLESVISDWVLIDPAGVAKFSDEHPDETDHGGQYELVRNWAAVDPEAAKKWIDSHGFASDIVSDFLDGWYLNDPTAAVAFAIAHADDVAISGGLGNILSALYVDSKEDAKKFIEQLPNDELRNKAFRSFEFKVNFGTAEETGEPDLTPRAVADWMIEFPPAYWREHLSHVFAFWNRDPPREVFSWIERQPAEIQGALADEYKVPTGKSAVETVTAILQSARPDLRDRMLAALFQHEGGSAWQSVEEITKSSLPADQKRHVLELAAKVERDEKAASDERARAESDQGSEK